MIESVLLLDTTTKMAIKRVSIDSTRPETLNLQIGEMLSPRHDGDIGWILTDSGDWINPNPLDPRDQGEWARHIRNRMLQKSDQYMMLDFPITDAEREQWRTYRQNLRDLPNQPGFPDSITWPVKPGE